MPDKYYIINPIGFDKYEIECKYTYHNPLALSVDSLEFERNLSFTTDKKGIEEIQQLLSDFGFADLTPKEEE